MSTADGLVISSSQVIANDLYRRTIAPRVHHDLTPSQLDKSVNLPGTLKSSGCSIPDPEEFLNLLMPLYESWDQRFIEDGFDKLRAEYLNRTIPIGKKIAVNSANNSTAGFFSGIRGDGALEIKNASGTEFITAGDVYLIGE